MTAVLGRSGGEGGERAATTVTQGEGGMVGGSP